MTTLLPRDPAVSDVTPLAAGDPGPSRVFVVDDHDLLAVGLRAAIGRDGVEVRSPSELSAGTIVAEAAVFRPHLVLLDLQLGDHRPSGLDLVAPLTALGGSVVVFSGVTDRLVLATVLEAGAAGIIGKHQRLEDIVDRIHSALAGFAVTSPAERAGLLGELRLHRATAHEQLEPFDRLSPRERLVLHDMIQGLSAEEMAEAHIVSLATVRSQIRAVLQKLAVHSQLAAVAYATRVGWKLDPSERRATHQRW